MVIQNFEFERLQLYDTLIKAFISKNIQASKYNDAEIKQRMSSAESAIITLNGEGLGSVKKQIDDAFNDFATKISDDNVVNTYKELIDYCSTHGAEVAEMAGNITANENAISTLETYIGKLPEDTDAKSVIEYINAKVEIVKAELVTMINTLQSALDIYKASNDATITDLLSRVETLEDIEYIPITEEQINSLFISDDDELA